MVDEKYIYNKFLKFNDIIDWCKSYAKETDGSLYYKLYDRRNKKPLSFGFLDTYLYDMGIPAYRHNFNLSYFNGKKAVFHLTVKGTGMAVVLICSFSYPNKELDENYEIEHDGQLCMKF